MPKWRLMTRVILAFNILMLLVWVVAVLSGGGDDCVVVPGEHGCAITFPLGPSVGSMVMWPWVAGNVILGIIWLDTNRKKTPASTPEPTPGRPSATPTFTSSPATPATGTTRGAGSDESSPTRPPTGRTANSAGP